MPVAILAQPILPQAILAQAILAQAILLLYPIPPFSCTRPQAPQIIDSPHNQPSTPPTQSCRPLGGRTLVNDIRGTPKSGRES